MLADSTPDPRHSCPVCGLWQTHGLAWQDAATQVRYCSRRCLNTTPAPLARVWVADSPNYAPTPAPLAVSLSALARCLRDGVAPDGLRLPLCRRALVGTLDAAEGFCPTHYVTPSGSTRC